MFDEFVKFYNAYLQKSPNASLTDIVRKFVMARAVGLHFGWTIHLDANTLERKDLYHSLTETCSKLEGNDGVKYDFVVEKPNDLSAQKLEMLLLLNRMYVDGELVNTAPEGSYTYMIGSTADGVPHIYALRVMTHHEIGTKHCRILERITSEQFGPDRMHTLHFAGEIYIQVENGKRLLSINVSSGTYMSGETSDNLKDTYLTEFRNFLQPFATKPVEISFGAKNLLPSVTTPRETIWLYLILGMRILIMRSPQECARYKKGEEGEGEKVVPKRIITSDQDELIRPIVKIAPKPKVVLQKRLAARKRKPIVAVVKRRNLRLAQPFILPKVEITSCPIVPEAPFLVIRNT
jgi:hypothetical protein